MAPLWPEMRMNPANLTILTNLTHRPVGSRSCCAFHGSCPLDLTMNHHAKWGVPSTVPACHSLAMISFGPDRYSCLSLPPDGSSSRVVALRLPDLGP